MVVSPWSNLYFGNRFSISRTSEGWTVTLVRSSVGMIGTLWVVLRPNSATYGQRVNIEE